jgi:hypothetical protein
MKISQLHIHLYAPEPTAKLTPEERLDVYDRVIERLKAARKIAYQTEAVVDRLHEKLDLPDVEVSEAFCADCGSEADTSGGILHGDACPEFPAPEPSRRFKVGDKAIVNVAEPNGSLLEQGEEVEILADGGGYYQVKTPRYPTLDWYVQNRFLDTAPIASCTVDKFIQDNAPTN